MDILLNDRHYKQTLGALEYLPNLNKGLAIREFFEKELTFKQVLPIKNLNILHKIHLVYRCNYLRDTVYAKEEGPSMPKSLVWCSITYTSDILNALLSTKVYL